LDACLSKVKAEGISAGEEEVFKETSFFVSRFMVF
jgi:hypothetical protein